MWRADYIPEPPLEPEDAWARFPQLDPYGEAFESAEAFSIDNDQKADWALRKIKAERDELQRLTELHDAEVAELDAKLDEAQRRCDSRTGHLLGLLERYFSTVEPRRTKTTEQYKLLNGSLVRKPGGVDYERDDEALADWLRQDPGKENLLNIKITPRWGMVKRLVQGDPETGAVTFAETGEIVPGLTAVRKPDSFDVKF